MGVGRSIDSPKSDAPDPGIRHHRVLRPTLKGFHSVPDRALKRPPSVLVVDDSITDRVRSVGLIQGRYPSWRVLQAADGPQGIEILSREPVNVVVCDLVMPGMDGRQFLQTVLQEHADVPVVLVTSQGDDQIAAECVSTGAVNYVPKRLLSDRLVKVLEEILAGQRETLLMEQVLRNVVRNRCEFRIESDLNQVRSLVNFIARRLRGFRRLTSEKMLAVTGAVREALLNAYFHGNMEVRSHRETVAREDYVSIAKERKTDPKFAGRKIRLRMELEADHLTFRIADDGPGFDACSLLGNLTSDEDWTTMAPGFRRMREAVDEVRYNERGNELTLIVRQGL